MYSPGTSGHYESLFCGNSSLNASRAEPMTLSPGNSPPTGPVNHYLPSFLIGDPSAGFSPSSPRIWPKAGSPGKQRRSLAASPPSPTSQGNIGLPMASSRTPRSFGGSRMTGDKPSGPPVVGLLETMSTPMSVKDGRIIDDSNNINNSFGAGLSFSGTPSTPFREFGRDIKSSSSPAQLDPFYTQGESLKSEEQLDETWVTVFGFPSAAASYILQQFSQYGTILEHKTERNGNWMHLHYQSKLQAKKALSKNGRVFGSSIMVGVKTCIEKKLMDDVGKENSFSWKSNRSEDSFRASSIRPLAQAYKVSSNERNVQQPSNTPTKNSNLFSRTMDYVFGL